MNYSKQPDGGYYENKEWYTKRNEEMYKDKMEGKLSNAELVAKYGISAPRIAYKVRQERAKNEFKRTR